MSTYVNLLSSQPTVQLQYYFSSVHWDSVDMEVGYIYQVFRGPVDSSVEKRRGEGGNKTNKKKSQTNPNQPTNQNLILPPPHQNRTKNPTEAEPVTLGRNFSK